MWKKLEPPLDSSKNGNSDNIVNQNLNNRENFKDVGSNLMCDSYKLASLIRKQS